MEVMRTIDLFISIVNFDVVYDQTSMCCWHNQVAKFWNVYGMLVCAFCGAMWAATGELPSSPTNKLFWAHSLAMVALKALGSGFLAFTLIGQHNFAIGNDFLILSMLFCWFVAHNTPLGSLLMQKAPRTVFMALAAVDLSNANCFLAKLGASTIVNSRPIYGIPLVGPVLVGTAVASVGPFLPLNVGLENIRRELPFIIQGSFVTAFLFHFLVNDTDGWVGVTLRCLLGTWGEREVRAGLAVGWIVTLVGQVHLGNSFNGVYAAVLSGAHAVFAMPDVCRRVCLPLQRTFGCCCGKESCCNTSADAYHVPSTCRCAVTAGAAKTCGGGAGCGCLCGCPSCSLPSLLCYHAYWLAVHYARYMLLAAAAIAVRVHFHAA